LRISTPENYRRTVTLLSACITFIKTQICEHAAA
jgi:hypothetical protein